MAGKPGAPRLPAQEAERPTAGQLLRAETGGELKQGPGIPLNADGAGIAELQLACEECAG